MARTTYSRDDVETHADNFGPQRPAVNVKVYGSIHDRRAWDDFHADEGPTPGFTLEWIEDNVDDETLDAIFWDTCASEFEYLAAWATDDEDAIFPRSVYGTVKVWQEGRSGGWAVVDGLPDLEDWDAIDLARWRKFERIAKASAASIPQLMLHSLYANQWEAAEAARMEDAGVEADVAQALAAL